MHKLPERGPDTQRQTEKKNNKKNVQNMADRHRTFVHFSSDLVLRFFCSRRRSASASLISRADDDTSGTSSRLNMNTMRCWAACANDLWTTTPTNEDSFRCLCYRFPTQRGRGLKMRMDMLVSILIEWESLCFVGAVAMFFSLLFAIHQQRLFPRHPHRRNSMFGDRLFRCDLMTETHWSHGFCCGTIQIKC